MSIKEEGNDYEIFKIYSKEMVEEEKKGKIGKINKIFNFKSTGFRKGENSGFYKSC